MLSSTKAGTRNGFWLSRAAMFIGLALIFLGVLFLLERFSITSVGIDRVWPVFIILLGIGMLAERARRRR